MAVNGTISVLTLGPFNPGGSVASGVAVGRRGKEQKEISEASMNELPAGVIHHSQTWSMMYEEGFEHGEELPMPVKTML